MVTVSAVDVGSKAEAAGILPGDILLSVNGNDISDILDYRYYITEKRIELLIHRGPELFTLSLEKGEYDDIGLEFETFLMDKKHTCRNQCIFCFIDQNPKGMRETIYFKDDDSRLSFLMGNYITLTNMTDKDIDRIIKMRMTPINISVHTTNPELRCQMLHNRFAGDTLRFLKKLTEAQITINCQIVLCKGVNDGKELEKTMMDLKAFYPYVGSVAIVPAGMTKFREGLYPLSPFTEQEAGATIDQINCIGDQCLQEYGIRLFYPSDEFYLTAHRDLPKEDFYDGYPQLENGVGMITSMETEFLEELPYIAEDYDLSLQRKFSIATGEAAYSFINRITQKLLEACPKLSGKVYLIKNDFFGHSITVAGLICGSDLIKQLSGKELGDVLYLSSSMLRDEGDCFLDDVTVSDVEKALGVKIVTTDSNGHDFIAKILEKW